MARKKLVDWKDVQILNIVQRDGRITSTELSKRIELTESPTFTRLQNLIKNGTIKRFRAELDLAGLGFRYPMIIQFKVPEKDAEQFIKKVEKHNVVLHWFELKPLFPINFRLLMAIAAFKTQRHYSEFELLLNTENPIFMEMKSWDITNDWIGSFEV